jgi:hypothetical protein
MNLNEPIDPNDPNEPQRTHRTPTNPTNPNEPNELNELNKLNELSLGSCIHPRTTFKISQTTQSYKTYRNPHSFLRDKPIDFSL